MPADPSVMSALEEIGELLGMSRERTREIEVRALAKLRVRILR